nr:unnamed protein product [Digitaria exilis]
MAQTPNPSRRSWVGPAPMPFLTPRPERRHLEMRWDDGGPRSAARRSGVGAVAGNGGSGGRGEMDREVNVQVVLRCRPLREDEQRANVQSVISCNDQKREEVTVLHSLFKEADKKFTFDKANKKICKSVVLKDLYQEMERMKQDVKAASEKNGIYIPHERFILDEAEKKAMREKLEHLELSLVKQNKGLKRSLASAQGISKTSIDFFKDIRIHVSRLIKIMEENQIQRYSKLLEFENEFKEICVNDEQAALDKIAAILSGLTAKKTTMVSTYVGQLNEIYSEEQKHLNLEMSNLQQVSDNGKDESVAYVGEVESRFQEDMSLHDRLNGQMEDILEQCLKNGEHSVSYWSHTQSSLHDLCKSAIMEADDFSEERRNKNEDIFQEKLTFSSQNDTEFHAIISDANSPIRHRPRELLTNANSLESIEELRSSVPDLVAKFRSENKLDENDKGKQFSDQRMRTPRSPLTPVNQYIE